MKKCLLILLGIVWGSLSFLFAENVPVDKALQVATRFAQQIGENPLRSGQSLELAYAARPSLRAAAPEAYYYVFNRGNNGGYIIIAGDDRAYPVLGYGTTGDFSYEKVPDNMKGWLQGYADQIQYACANGLVAEAEIQQEWNALVQGSGLPRLRAQTLLTTALWNQGAPYNNRCPLIGGQRALTGCVATSMGIVMKYHGWPVQGKGSASTSQGNYSANFNVNYAWNNMLNEYLPNQYTVDQGEAVATLLYHCGVSCNMGYGVSASGTQSGRIITALTTYFGYDKGIAYMQKDDYADSDWRSMLSQELETYSRPVLYSGSGTGGHAFVIDGVESTRYHLNWGWGGYLNGWFPLTALNPGGDNYSSDQAMIINVKPDAGGSYLNELRISNTSSYRGGLKVTETPVQGKTFTLTLSALRGISPDFVASIAIAHFDKSKKMKGLVSRVRDNYSFDPYSYYSNMSFSCTITETIEEGDQLYLVSKVAGGEYKIVQGGPNVTSVINLTNATPSDVYQVTWNTLSGITVSPVSGYDPNSVAAGEDFKFKIINTTGKAITVRNGLVSLAPDESGVYTISNIQKDIQLLLSLSTITYQVTWNTLTGVTVVPESGYNASSVTAGGTFKFKVTGPSDKKVVVKNGSATLTPSASGVYTLSNIQKNIQLTISLESLTEYKIIIPSYVPGVIIQLPTGFTGKVKSGDSFYFKADPASSAYAVGVKVNGKYVYRDYGANGAEFKIYSIDRDQKIEIEAIDLSRVTTTKTVTTTAGNLNNYITDRECCYLQHLIVKGKINKTDMIFMSNNLPEISSIDLSDVTLTGNKVADYDLCFIYKVKEIILPSSVTAIGHCAFGYNPQLSRVVMNRSVPPTLDENAFIGIPSSQLTIVVPSGAGPAYRAASVWKNYTIVEMAATTYRVTWPVVTGFEVKASAGYDALSVPAGSDFKFTVTPKAGYEAYTVKVTANNVVLTPASGNVYTIRNVTANQTVRLEVTPPDTPATYQVLSRADRGAELVAESGYDAHSVASGDDFKFHVSVDPAYREWELKVEVDGLTLRPDSRGVYTISNIRADKNVVITLTEIYTVTFVKPKEDVTMVSEAGYDADRIVAGSDFKFHLASRYTEDQLTVASNGVVLRPIGKTYTIYGIRENQQVTVIVHDVGNEKISAENVRIEVRGCTLCITHPNMKDVPVYITSFGGTLIKADRLNGNYTELDVRAPGNYIVSFQRYNQKVMVR